MRFDRSGVRGPTAGRTEFEELYAGHFRGLTLQINAYVGDLAEAQDLVQEAFTRAVARWDRIAKYDDPAAWVRRVAWNLATSRWRRRRVAAAFLLRQREQHVAGPNPDRVALTAALATLPPVLRKAFVLHYIAQLSIAEIAEEEDVAEGTVKSWLHRGRALVAAQLTDPREGN
ncbi:RNA polymerase sigma factor [Dactylosporangium fulvum]|uniref:Sigma-70 family RNA polymerase sigma factor n=1 Tax=Dactylosporangium fulvum TaxID=53359 RepID=A0ABY5W2C9_9ACTN|nr:sigma-70 family RNA polymerase sigma factor [Dactylosporangium fulvum]UWP83266.1 sigma-70 family RNA polymerase sigma factor [Dactylosporangium fulvum]